MVRSFGGRFLPDQQQSVRLLRLAARFMADEVGFRAIAILSLFLGAQHHLIQLVSSTMQVEAEGAIQVVATDDITAESDCQIVRDRYNDASYTTVVESSVEACPANTVLHSFPTTEREALAARLPYYKLTGDDVSDEAGIAALKRSIQPPMTVNSKDSVSLDVSSDGSCPVYYYSAGVSYTVFSKSRTVYHSVFYRTSGNCDGGIYVTSAYDQLSANPSSGGIYWRYTIWNGALIGNTWGMGCRQLSDVSSRHSYGSPGWFGYSSSQYSWADEVIDYYPCTGGSGNSYVGQVRL